MASNPSVAMLAPFPNHSIHLLLMRLSFFGLDFLPRLVLLLLGIWVGGFVTIVSSTFALIVSVSTSAKSAGFLVLVGTVFHPVTQLSTTNARVLGWILLWLRLDSICGPLHLSKIVCF